MRGKKVSCYRDGTLVSTFDSIDQAGRNVGVDPSGITKALKGGARTAGGYTWKPANGEGKEPTNELYVTEDMLHERHDMLYRLKQELDKIPEGAYIEETRMLKKLGMAGKAGYRSATEHPDIRAYKGKADGIVYYGHPAAIERNKTKGLLS